MDLFFYRDPEEAKDKQEELPGLPEYPDYSGAALTSDWTTSQIPDGQWSADPAPAPVAATGGWAGEVGKF